MIETSRTEPHSVEFQSGPKGGSGSSFELGKEIEKEVFCLVMGVGQ